MSPRQRHSSARRRFLVAYNIADPGRLRMVHKTVKAHGEPLQYSVVLCDLSPSELTSLKWSLGELMNHREDSMLFLDLGDPTDMSAFHFLGERADLPSSGPVVL